MKKTIRIYVPKDSNKKPSEVHLAAILRDKKVGGSKPNKYVRRNKYNNDDGSDYSDDETPVGG